MAKGISIAFVLLCASATFAQNGSGTKPNGTDQVPVPMAPPAGALPPPGIVPPPPGVVPSDGPPPNVCVPEWCRTLAPYLLSGPPPQLACPVPPPPVDGPPCLWFSAEYLLWSVKHGPVVPLATTSPTGAGVLGQPGT